MPALAMAFACNHLISWACELDREATEENLAMLDSEDPLVRSRCPLLAPARDRAHDAAHYAASYVAKIIKSSQAANTIKAMAAVTCFLLQDTELQHQNDPEAASRAGFGNFLSCVNRLTTDITMGTAMISYRLRGLKTYWASYDVKPMPTLAYTGRALRQAGVSDHAVHGGQLGVTLVPQGDGYCAVTAVTDYDHRGDALEALPPYVYHSMYARRQRPKPKAKAKKAKAKAKAKAKGAGGGRARKRRRTGAGAGAAPYVDADAAGGSSDSSSEEEGVGTHRSEAPARGRPVPY